VVSEGGILSLILDKELKAGKSLKVLKSNAKVIMAHGVETKAAYRQAYEYAHANTKRRFDSIHRRSQKEQRAR